MRSSGGHSWSIARMRVVLPRPMPPATRMFSRARMAARSRLAMPSSYIFQSRTSVSWSASTSGWRRIDT